MVRVLLFSASLLVVSFTAFPSLADEDGRLQPRAETSLKYGTERTIGSGEVWVPLDQGQDRVLYGDLRLMGDDDDNTEGNVGIGYRQLVRVPGTDSQAIAGAHAWIDRRHTDHDNHFHQATIGAELLGHDLDARVNAYLPLNDEKSYRTPNIGQVTPYLAGSGILYDTTGTAIEEPQPGIDLELGWRLPIFEQHTEAIRLYGGGYHFEGDQTEDVSGWRTRLVADISPAVSIGGRLQRDDERGSQGFIEATLRFPFSAKRSFRAEGLRARLDESPERDIDIVAGGKVTDTGLAKPVLAAATGEQQRVLHVDNTAAPGGDGSKERPFHQLKLAEAALQAHDVIYVHEGDGTTTGQNLGIVIDKPNVSLIGSGSDFIYDAGRFTTDKGAGFNGIVLAEATTAPVITNSDNTTLQYVDATGSSFYGNGVLMVGVNQYVSGIVVDGAKGSGVRIVVDGMGSNSDTARVNEVISRNNLSRGISVTANQGIIDSAEITNSRADFNAGQGLLIASFNGGTINYAQIISSEASYNTGINGYGINIQASGLNSKINKTVVSDNMGTNNATYGLWLISYTGHINESLIYDNKFSDNTVGGIIYEADNGGSLASYLDHNEIMSNDQNGFVIQSTNNSNASIGLERNSINMNGRFGVHINDDTTGSFSADFGGGTLGSTGRNSIYGNGTVDPATYRDVRLDLDGSLTPLPAQGNWWGQPGGPIAGQIVSEGAGSPPAANTGTADTSNALSSDPNL